MNQEFNVNDEVTDETLLEASEVLTNAIYRKAAEWEQLVRQEKPVEQVDQVGEELAQIATQADKLISAYGPRKVLNPDIETDPEIEEAFNEARQANTYTFHLGTEYSNTLSSFEPENGDFVLINGKADQLYDVPVEDTYTPVKEFLDKYSTTNIEITEVNIEQDVELERLRPGEDGYILE